MPQFILNTPDRAPPAKRPHPYYALDDFAKGYVEALFFTNGDTGDEREGRLNEMGVERLTRASVAKIKEDCDAFQAEHTGLLTLAYATGEYTPEQAGRDFWFTRQGHGAGFWDRGQLDDSRALWRELGRPRIGEPGWDEYTRRKGPTLGEKLSGAAKAFGECYVETWRGWVHVR